MTAIGNTPESLTTGRLHPENSWPFTASVVKADFEEAGDDDVFRKVKSDLDAKGAGLSDHQIRREMDDLMATAMEQVKAG